MWTMWQKLWLWSRVKHSDDSGGRQSALVPDAHLAALAIEHGLILCSADGDFARFPGLRWQNPLEVRGKIGISE